MFIHLTFYFFLFLFILGLLTRYLSKFIPQDIIPQFVRAVTKFFYYLMYRIVTASPHEHPPDMTVAPLPAALYSIAAATMLEAAVGLDESSLAGSPHTPERAPCRRIPVEQKEQIMGEKLPKSQSVQSAVGGANECCIREVDNNNIQTGNANGSPANSFGSKQMSVDQSRDKNECNAVHNDAPCQSTSNEQNLSTTLEEIAEDVSMETIDKGGSRSMSIEEKGSDNPSNDCITVQPDGNISPILKGKIVQADAIPKSASDGSFQTSGVCSKVSIKQENPDEETSEGIFIPTTLRKYILAHAKEELEKRKQMIFSSEQQQAAPVKISLFSPLLSSNPNGEYPGISTPHTPASPFRVHSPRSPLTPYSQLRSPGLFSPLLKTPLPTRGPTIRASCDTVGQSRFYPRSFTSNFSPTTMMCSPYLFLELLQNLKFTAYGTLMKALDQFIQLSFSSEFDDFYSLLYDHLVSVIIWTNESPVHAAFHGITSIASNYIFRIVMHDHVPRKYAFKYTLVEWIFQQVLYTAKARLQLLMSRLKIQDLDEEIMHFVPSLLLAGVAKGVPLDTVLLSLIIVVLKMHRRHASVNKIAAVYLGTGGLYEALYPPQLVHGGQSGDIVSYCYYVFVPCFYKIIEKEKRIESSKKSLLEFANATGTERLDISSNVDLILHEAQKSASASATAAAPARSVAGSAGTSPHTPKRQKIQRGFFSPLSPLSKTEVAKRARVTSMTPMKSRYELRHLDESRNEVSVDSPPRGRSRTGASPKRKTSKKTSAQSPASKRSKLEKENGNISAADYKQYEDEVLDILTCGKASTPKKETVHQALAQPGELDLKSATLSENDKVAVDVLTQLSRNKFSDTTF